VDRRSPARHPVGYPGLGAFYKLYEHRTTDMLTADARSLARALAPERTGGAVKIGQVTTFLVSVPGAPRTCLFVKLETDDGLVGWGECATFADRDLVVEQHVKSMTPYIVGRDPFAI